VLLLFKKTKLFILGIASWEQWWEMNRKKYLSGRDFVDLLYFNWNNTRKSGSEIFCYFMNPYKNL
jgi:hypothetical protein